MHRLPFLVPCSRVIPGMLLAATMILGFVEAVFADEIDFNRDIRPILSENCFYCHGQDANKRQAELRLDDRDAAIEYGAITPGDKLRSSVIDRIHSTDPENQMPPPKSNRRLSEAQKQLLDRWIVEGAKYSKHWAFDAPRRPELPLVQNQTWASGPIDHFVLSKLESVGLQNSSEADRSVLMKRLYADLIGLPPSPAELRAFLDDQSPDSYERLVDRLLASPHYGERLSLPWLDAARYADSNGFQQDGDTWQWIWRDWLVRSVNDDMPFDQFTIWQLAGDLLPNATTEQKIASGFNRNHLLNGEGGAIAEEQRWVILFDRMDTTCTTWLGLTMACAQCHDHKYDPMTQRDYYSLLDAFNRVPETGTPQRFSSRIRVAPPIMELPTEENKAQIAALEKQIESLENEAKPIVDAAFEGWKLAVTAEAPGLPEPAAKILRRPEGERSDAEKKTLADALRKHFDEKVRATVASKFPQLAKMDAVRKKLADYKADQIPRVMIMSDDKPRETAILERGEYLKPTSTKVNFAPPAFLPPLPDGAPSNRLGFAQWLVAENHPLTARVQVNRLWQHFFGTGLIKTAEDFGVQSEYPIHGALLDWMATEFRDQGWSSKRLQRQIVTSSTYRQSSKVTPELLSRDAENRLMARASRFRMPSMVLRDWALAASGLLDQELGGVPVYPYQPDAVWEALAITKERDFTYPQSKGKDLYRRSIYTFWRRTVAPADMFDASNRQTCRVRSSVTSTPLHALTTLNDPAWVEAARSLAERLLKSEQNADQRLVSAIELVLCRKPSDREIEKLRSALERQRQIFESDNSAAVQAISIGDSKPDPKLSAVELAALTQVCLAILNLDEALTRE